MLVAILSTVNLNTVLTLTPKTPGSLTLATKSPGSLALATRN